MPGPISAAIILLAFTIACAILVAESPNADPSPEAAQRLGDSELFT